MTKGRLEGFSDGVIAILITIMVLELHVPEGASWSSLRPLLPVLLAYVLSFVNLGIYWSNHHHMLHLLERPNGKILWANLHLLFWLSLFPFTTAWMGGSEFAAVPTSAYGIAAVMAAFAYMILQRQIIAAQGSQSPLARAVGRDAKGKASPFFYLAGIAMAFVSRWIALGLYVAVAAMWLVPDRRIESLPED